jgi:membrane-bound lytic murein transglycosylase B
VDTGRDRSGFFSDELMQFFVLSREEGLPVDEVTGSYAGAMGLGQFIPSSYRAYAVDFDEDGRRDLWSSKQDAIGSVANYLAVHGWTAGEPVVARVKANGSADASIVSESYKPERPAGDFADAGYVPVADVSRERNAALLALEEKDGESHWLVFDNFYVITRYNRSALYAMAVWQLSEAIREGYAE